MALPPASSNLRGGCGNHLKAGTGERGLLGRIASFEHFAQGSFEFLLFQTVSTPAVDGLHENIRKDVHNMNKLILSALGSYLTGVVILGLFLFVPAWTINYWQAWVFIFVFTTCVNAIGVYLSIKDPVLLERRKNVGPAAEQSLAQRIIMSLAMIGIVALLVYCATDHRLGWSPVPAYTSLLGDLLVALGLLFTLLVFKENSFGGSTIQTFEDQKVISTGP